MSHISSLLPITLAAGDMATTIYSQPASTSTGEEAVTNTLYAVARLKEKFPESIPTTELIAYVLPTHKRNDHGHVESLLDKLKRNERISFDRKTNSFKFLPHHNILAADDLLAFLQNQDTATGISVRELKDGWPDVEATIDTLEKQHKLLVTRNKKDNHARMVWADDPTLIAPLDDEYRELWEKIPVPEQEVVIKELEQGGMKTAGMVAKKQIIKKEAKKVKKTVRTGNLTNTHMQKIFKDYSGKRPAAGGK